MLWVFKMPIVSFLFTTLLGEGKLKMPQQWKVNCWLANLMFVLSSMGGGQNWVLLLYGSTKREKLYCFWFLNADAEIVIQIVSIKLFQITIIEKSNLIQIFGNIVVMVCQTRLSYNCAHLRSTKESLTFEYLDIIFLYHVSIARYWLIHDGTGSV